MSLNASDPFLTILDIVVFQSSSNNNNLISVVVIPVLVDSSLTKGPTLSGVMFNLEAIS